eukprot:6430247-Amphidinium_carterae.1
MTCLSCRGPGVAVDERMRFVQVEDYTVTTLLYYNVAEKSELLHHSITDYDFGNVVMTVLTFNPMFTSTALF